MGLLDKGTTKEALGGRSGDGPLRAVRAKREADEAGNLESTLLLKLLAHVRNRQGISKGCPLAGDSSTSARKDTRRRISSQSSLNENWLTP
jgi:hypothetical protein